MASLSPIERAEQELAAIESAMTAEPAAQAPEPSQAVAPPQEAPPAEQPTPPQDDYYQKWKSLDGMLKKKDEQIGQLMEQNRGLFEKLEQLADRMAQQPAAPPQPSHSELISALSSEFGEDTVAAIEKVAAAKYDNKIAHLEAKISELTGMADSVHNLAEAQGRTKAELFQAGLTERVSDWRQIHASPDWARWLDSNVDEISGQTYAALFDRANDDWNANVMVTLFNKFKATVNKQVADPRDHLQTPSGRGVGPSGAQQPRVWRQVDIEEAYETQRRGGYTDEQWAGIEADIWAAYTTGRVM